MTLRSSLKTLLVVVVALPIVQSVLVGVRFLLESMGDAAGAEFIRQVGNVCLALWLVTLVGLVLLTAVVVLLDGRVGNGRER